MVFAYLEPRHLLAAACVCRHWSDIALDCLWFEVRDLKRVLAVLAPLVLHKRRATATEKVSAAYVRMPTLTPLLTRGLRARFGRYSNGR